MTRAGSVAGPQARTQARVARLERLPADRVEDHVRLLNAESVPVELGGRLERPEVAARVGRAVFRRGVPFALACGAPWLPGGSAAVWSAGTPAQRSRVAATLLGGARMAVAHYAPTHGHGLTCGEITAAPSGDGFLLSGVKPAVPDAHQARTLLVYARTPSRPWCGTHTAFLTDGAPERADERTRRLPPVPGGHPAVGLAFRARPLPVSAVLGRFGDGVPLALRSFLASWATVPGMLLGAADSALRTAVGAALDEPAHSGPLSARPHHRAVVADGFAVLLLLDCLTLAAGRAAYLLPDAGGLPAAAAGLLVPRLLRESARDLSVLLGPDRDLPGGRYDGFREHVRTLPLAGLGRAESAACLSVLVPQLRRVVGECGRRADVPAPAAFFDPWGQPPAAVARFDAAAVADPLAATLAAACERLGAEAGPLPGLVRGLRAELCRVRRACSALPDEAAGSSRQRAQAERYALLAAAAACLGVWESRPGGFLSETAWLVQALSLLSRLLGLAAPGTAAARERLAAEAVERFRCGRTFDLYGAVG